MRSDMIGRTFNWGIIGTGGIARQFAADLRLLPYVRLAGVCSVSYTHLTLPTKRIV